MYHAIAYGSARETPLPVLGPVGWAGSAGGRAVNVNVNDDPVSTRRPYYRALECRAATSGDERIQSSTPAG